MEKRQKTMVLKTIRKTNRSSHRRLCLGRSLKFKLIDPVIT